MTLNDATTALPHVALTCAEQLRHALGRLGGAKGGAARALALTPERRREIAQQAAAKRWKAKEEIQE